MHYSQAGGGGPQGVARRAGSAEPGFLVLAALGGPFGLPPSHGIPAQLAAVRHAVAVWQVTTVVITPDPGVPAAEQGSDPVYAAAFMTAALGRLPTLQAGAWVWDDVDVRLGVQPPFRMPAGALTACALESGPALSRATASMAVPDCVRRAALPGG